jgi:chorismate mutase
MTSEGKEIGLSPEFIMQLFKAIHQESIIHQEKVMNKQ